MMTPETVARTWFSSLDNGDYATAMGCLAENIEWVNIAPVKGVSDVIPWIGTAHGIKEVTEAFRSRDAHIDLKLFKPVSLIVQGNEACGTIHEISVVKATGIAFEITFATWMKIAAGKIVRWQSFCDPSPIIAAFRGDLPTRRPAAVESAGFDSTKMPMIHQHIYASPKPGMSEAAFQRYWLETHAVHFAAKIPQIKKYKIDTRIDWKGESKPPMWSGIAEIWLRNEKEQLESLQTPEFLGGARLDEPKWAAFWNTLVLDTDTHVVQAGSPETRDCPGVKLLVLTKRKPGMTVGDYRKHTLGALRGADQKIAGLQRCWQCFTRDAWYAAGEPRFDGITHLWFDDLGTMEEILTVEDCKEAFIPGAKAFVEPRYVFTMATREHWVIGPEQRA